ncbi:hypothetical protein [Sphingomonas sp. LHG3443-2]|uniref:hypothetical protein n=1 Tax=Sphingomonas sp. LHG3443-2 TaxID=2804639 RepID=UPI003CF15372
MENVSARKSIRRENPPPLNPIYIATEDKLLLAISDELHYAERRLSAVGDVLANDPNLIFKHGARAQEIDLIGQILCRIAEVISSSDPTGRARRLGNVELRSRLLKYESVKDTFG